MTPAAAAAAVSRGGAAPANAPSGPRGGGGGRDAVVDGSMGFDDPMETDNGRGYVIDAGRASSGSRPRNGLYSDSLVQGNGGGSGQQRGGGGGGGGRGYGRGGRRGGPGR